MAIAKTSSLFAAVGAASLLLLVACDPSDGGGGETGSTTGGPTTGGPQPTTGIDPSGSSSSAGSSSTTFDPSGSTTSGPGATSGSSTSDGPSGSSSSTSGSESSSSTGGEPTDCVDEDIEDAVGEAVASGTNVGYGDDFQLRFCFGDWGGSGGATTSFGETGDSFGGTSISGTDTFGGTDSFGGTTTGVGGTGGWDPEGDDYVISWTPPADGAYVLDTFGSPMDTVLSVVPPSCGARAEVCNDDCQGLDSAVVYDATAGEIVYIVIEGYGGGEGNFVLNITGGDHLECGFGGSTGGFPDTDGFTTMATATSGI